jgi:hypothetical protein
MEASHEILNVMCQRHGFAAIDSEAIGQAVFTLFFDRTE